MGPFKTKKTNRGKLTVKFRGCRAAVKARIP